MEKKYIEQEAALSAVCASCKTVPEKERELCPYKFTGCGEYYGIFTIPAADVREVVLCKDCKYWKDRHIKQKDGTERQYRDGEPMYVDLNVGVNVGSMCCYEVGRGWGGMDKRVFRNQDDFCSRGEKRPVKYEKWWGIVDGKYPLCPNCGADMRGK